MTTKTTPALRFIRRPKVEEKTGYHRTAIYEKIGKGEFPKPYPLSNTGRAVAWLESEVDAWIAARIEASNNRGKNAL